MLLAVEVAQLADQVLIEDLLTVDGASGPLRADRRRGRDRPAHLAARRGPLPGQLSRHGRRRPPRRRDRRAADRAAARRCRPRSSPDLWPSRYCESDRFEAFVERTFGDARRRRQGAGDGRMDPARDRLCHRLERRDDDRGRRLRLAPGRLPRLRPSDGELRPRRRHPRPAGLGLCLGPEAARLPRRGRGLAGRRLAFARRDRPRAARRASPASASAATPPTSPS